jgi:hypothetical protein
MINVVPFNQPNYMNVQSKHVNPKLSAIKGDMKEGTMEPARIKDASINIVWGSLLGKSNEELQKEALYFAPELLEHIKGVREDLLRNYDDYDKYPALDKKDVT